VILSEPGKQVISVPLGIILTAPQQVVVSDPEAEGRRSAEEGEWQGAASRAEAAEVLMDTAEGLQNQAEDLEEGANEDGLPASVREDHRKSAQSMRAQAAKLEREAKAMLGAR
jgi:hypothetical protein